MDLGEERDKEVETFSRGSYTAELMGSTYGARALEKVTHEINYDNGAYREITIEEEGSIEVRASGPLVTAFTGKDQVTYEAHINDDEVPEMLRNKNFECYKDPDTRNLDKMIFNLDIENIEREYTHL